MNVEHPTLNFEHRIPAGGKYQVNWEKVDPKFCETRCNAWMAKTGRCGTLYTTVERKGKCMWENPRLRAQGTGLKVRG